jgi:hypothetical protein
VRRLGHAVDKDGDALEDVADRLRLQRVAVKLLSQFGDFCRHVRPKAPVVVQAWRLLLSRLVGRLARLHAASERWTPAIHCGALEEGLEAEMRSLAFFTRCPARRLQKIGAPCWDGRMKANESE